jgi:hypothetical protein
VKAAAFRAWTQPGHHHELSESYALANQELVDTKALAAAVDSEQELAKIVSDGEGAISRA